MPISAPTNWINTTHAELELPAADTLQGFVIQDDWSIIASQGVPNGTVEDTYLAKLNPDGSLINTMVAPGAGHGTILGHLGHDKILFDFNGALVAAMWRRGQITRSSPGVPRWGGVFQNGPMSAVIDRLYGRAGFYHHDDKTVTLRALADVDTQTDRVLGQAGPLTNRDKLGRLTLRQGWALYDQQLFYLIGDGQQPGSQELLSYDLTTGNMLWRRSAKLCGDIAWQEPEGLFVSDLGVLSGNPMIYVGFTNRTSQDPIVRQHVIMRLKDPNTVLAT